MRRCGTARTGYRILACLAFLGTFKEKKGLFDVFIGFNGL
jgi:hypothetical protein